MRNKIQVIDNKEERAEHRRLTAMHTSFKEGVKQYRKLYFQYEIAKNKEPLVLRLNELGAKLEAQEKRYKRAVLDYKNKYEPDRIPVDDEQN